MQLSPCRNANGQLSYFFFVVFLFLFSNMVTQVRTLVNLMKNDKVRLASLAHAMC